MLGNIEAQTLTVSEYPDELGNLTELVDPFVDCWVCSSGSVKSVKFRLLWALFDQ